MGVYLVQITQNENLCLMRRLRKAMLKLVKDRNSYRWMSEMSEYIVDILVEFGGGGGSKVVGSLIRLLRLGLVNCR